MPTRRSNPFQTRAFSLQCLTAGQVWQFLSRKHDSYWTWSPALCRPHFATKYLRIEIDTSAETGIGEWNYIDYGRQSTKS